MHSPSVWRRLFRSSALLACNFGMGISGNDLKWGTLAALAATPHARGVVLTLHSMASAQLH